jgi:hypothetical protein
MVSTFTPNIQLEEPARGDDVGTWDTPVNNNSTLLDLVSGGIATVGVTAGNVNLSAAQFQSDNITFNSTLVASITVTFPTSINKPYEIFHAATGSSAFTITLQTTAGGATFCPPPGVVSEIRLYTGNIFWKSGPLVGTYWDYAGSSVPNWVSGSSPAPFLLCDGSTVSATYTALAALGITTLPDARGRARYALDAGVGRVTSVVSGVAGNTIFAGGGDQHAQAHNHTAVVTDPTHAHALGSDLNAFNAATPGGGSNAGSNLGITATAAAVTGITVSIASNLSGASQNMSPVYVGGITMIRAA